MDLELFNIPVGPWYWADEKPVDKRVVLAVTEDGDCPACSRFGCFFEIERCGLAIVQYCAESKEFKDKSGSALKVKQWTYVGGR